MDVFGTVVDQQGNPLPYVNVAARNVAGQITGTGTTTNAYGVFDLRGLNSGDTLQFSFIGYRTAIPLLRAAPAQNTVVMEATAYEQPEVVIFGDPINPDGTKKPVIKLEPLDISVLVLLLAILGFAGYAFFSNR
jgi:hypothetical protein